MSDTDDQLALIDDTIAADRVMFLRATWAGHEGEARWYAVEVDRLRNLRDTIERMPRPTAREVPDA